MPVFDPHPLLALVAAHLQATIFALRLMILQLQHGTMCLLRCLALALPVLTWAPRATTEEPLRSQAAVGGVRV